LQKKVTGSLDGADDVDYFKFKTGKGTSYTFDAQNINVTTHSWASDYKFGMQITSEIGEILNDTRLSTGSSNSEQVVLQPDTWYYIKVFNPYQKAGNYSFKIATVKKSIQSATVTLSKNSYS
jgi:nucleoside-specific outer membrane channel protein Tsx